MKKTISFIILLFANLILLAHSIVPHHHHSKTVVCLANTHCTDSDEAHHHHDDGKHHDRDTHSGNSDSNNCVINNIYTRFGSEGKTLLLSENTDISFVIIPEAALHNQLSLISSLEHWIPFRQKPYLVFHQNTYLSLSKGLRAPPFC